MKTPLAVYSASNPRFIWNVGAIREEFPDMPDSPEVSLWDRKERKAVVTVHSQYAQLICLETTTNGAPFEALADWCNGLSDKVLASEGIPASTWPARRIARTERIAAAQSEAITGCEPDASLLAIVNCFDQDNEPVGYYEILTDGTFACNVARDGILDANEDVVRDWLLVHALN